MEIQMMDLEKTVPGIELPKEKKATEVLQCWKI